jgi:hypothetical protein
MFAYYSRNFLILEDSNKLYTEKMEKFLNIPSQFLMLSYLSQKLFYQEKNPSLNPSLKVNGKSIEKKKVFLQDKRDLEWSMMQSQRIGSLVLVPKVSKRLKNSIIG